MNSNATKGVSEFSFVYCDCAYKNATAYNNKRKQNVLVNFEGKVH